MTDAILRDLEPFIAVARTRNFRRAAVEQGMSVSSLSQRLRDLEQRLGIRLVNRTTRSVALTQAGELLLERIGPSMRTIADAITQVRGLRAVPSGRLRINSSAAAVDLVMAPMVAPFLRQFPQIELEIVTQLSLIDIVAEGFDAGVRWSEHLAQDMIAVSLGGPHRYAVVATPDVVERYGRPKHPRDLLKLPCVRMRFENGVIPDWAFEKAGKVVKVSPRGPLIASYSDMYLKVVHGGIGYWRSFEGYVRDAVASGTLVRVLDDWCQPFPGPFLYYPSRRQPPPALAAFLAFVAAWRKEEKAKGGGSIERSNG